MVKAKLSKCKSDLKTFNGSTFASYSVGGCCKAEQELAVRRLKQARSETMGACIAKNNNTCISILPFQYYMYKDKNRGPNEVKEEW